MHITYFYRKPYDFHFSIEKVFRKVRNLLPGHTTQSDHTSPYPSKGIMPRIKNILAARKAQHGINHITGDIHYIAFGLKGRHTILTIHDLGFMKHPNPVARLFLWFFWVYGPVHRVRYVTTISEATRKDILKYSRCRPEKVIVIPNYRDDSIPYLPMEFNTDKPVLLQIGTKFNKNLERLIQAVEGLSIHLRIIGHLSDEQASMLEERGIDHSTAANLSEQQLIEAYQHCDMVTFCSTLEGFGLPILEAQSTGRPVVTSNVSSMPEVGGKGACYIDPFDVVSIRSAIRKVIEDEDYRKQLVQDGLENVKRFDPEVVAEEYMNVYRKVYDENNMFH